MVLSDFLVEDALPTFSRAVEFVVNDARLSNDTWLTLDERLAQAITGIRDAVFCIGSPLVWDGEDRPASQYELAEAHMRRPNWNVWWRPDPARHTSLRVPDDEDAWIEERYRRGIGGRVVFPKSSAFDLYALRNDTFYANAVPVVVLEILRRWPNAADIPDAALDLKQWVFCPVTPDQSWVLPPVSSSEFRKLRDSF